jgi:hypothetical protein
MISDKDSHIAKTNILNKLWVIFGGVLGVIFSLIVVTERTQNLFPQLGAFEKIIDVIVLGSFGIGITRQCNPTKKALVGGVIFPVLWTVSLFLIAAPRPISPVIIIGAISIGILLGILVGTAWQGAFIGTILVVLILIVLDAIVPGTVGLGWFFMPLGGTVAGAMLQMALNDFIGKRPTRNNR